MARNESRGNYDEHQWIADWHKFQVEKLKCECGADVTYGKGCPDEYHSDYCPKQRPLAEVVADGYIHQTD